MFGMSLSTIAKTAGIAFAVDIIGDVTGIRARVANALRPSA